MVTVEVAGAVVEVVDVEVAGAVVEVVDEVAVGVAGAMEEQIGKSKFWWKFYEINLTIFPPSYSISIGSGGTGANKKKTFD